MNLIAPMRCLVVLGAILILRDDSCTSPAGRCYLLCDNQVESVKPVDMEKVDGMWECRCSEKR